jgi:hypothetical protein
MPKTAFQLNLKKLPEFTGIFAKENGGGFLVDRYRKRAKPAGISTADPSPE